jgi:hypothetical protein
MINFGIGVITGALLMLSPKVFTWVKTKFAMVEAKAASTVEKKL